MSQMPIGENGIEYTEVRMLIEGYANQLATGKVSYYDLLRKIDRLTELAKRARELWGDR